MENDNNGGQGPQSGTVKPLWEVLGSQTDTITITQSPIVETAQTTDVVDPPAVEATLPAVEPAKTEPVKPEGEPPVVEVKTDAIKTDEVKVDELEPLKLELTVADIKDAPTTYEDGTFQALGEDFGLTLPEESYESFRKEHDAKYILRDEAQKQNITTKEQLFKTLTPELATAFELIDLGVPPELALNPTKIHDEWLAKSSAEVVRDRLMNIYKDEEIVNSKMETLSEDPQKLEIEAKAIKADVTIEKNNILQEQQNIAQKHRDQNQQIALRQKAEMDNQFKNALAEEQAFMGLTLSKEVKDAILLKYNKGLYETALNPAQAKIRAILQLEYGDKFAKAIESKAKQQAKAEVIGKLSDMPIKVTPQSGQRQQVVVADNNQETKGAFANMPFVH